MAEKPRPSLIDQYMERQRRSIDRLLAHLKVHCPELNPDDPNPAICPHMEAERQKVDPT